MNFSLNDCLSRLINSFVQYPEHQGTKIGFIDATIAPEIGLLSSIHSGYSDREQLVRYYMHHIKDKKWSVGITAAIRLNDILSFKIMIPFFIETLFDSIFWSIFIYNRKEMARIAVSFVDPDELRVFMIMDNTIWIDPDMEKIVWDRIEEWDSSPN